MNFLPFEEARAIARKTPHRTSREWHLASAKDELPKGVPRNPHVIYKDCGWVSWMHWFGKDKARQNNFLPFDEALKTARRCGLKTMRQWQQAAAEKKLLEGLPASPHIVYKDSGWISWIHWFGKDKARQSKFLPFDEALKTARRCGLKTVRQWREAAAEKKLLEGLPASPHIVYKDSGWISWIHWFGKDKARQSKFLPFDEARKLAVRLGCRSKVAWEKAVRDGRVPQGVPAAPHLVYKNTGWYTWEHWVGKIERPG